METYMTMIGVIVAVLAASFLIGARDRRRSEKNERLRLIKGFGSPGDKEYPEGWFRKMEDHLSREQSGLMIDGITWNDLDMDLLFRNMDRTCSSAGEEYLYQLLRFPCLDTGSSVSEEGLLWWTENEKERVDVQRILQRLARNSRYPLYDCADRIEDMKEISVYREYLAVLLPLISLCIMIIRPPAGLLCLLASFAFNIVTYFKIKRKIDPYLFTLRTVIRLLTCSRSLAALPFPHYEEEKKVMRSAVGELDSFSRGSGILLRNAGSGVSGISSSDPAGLVLDYLCILFHIDLIKYSSMRRQLMGKKSEVEALIRAVGAIDAQISIASWRMSLPVYCIPELTKSRIGNSLEVTDLIHPLVSDPVPNSMTVSSPVLVTGSNASGKSTFLKAIALAALLSQTVHTAPAASYRNCPCRIYTSMALRDDITGGESYFIVEIRSLKRVLDAASAPEGTPVLCCIDEVLRGTNTTERVSASAQILLALSRMPAQIFAATHDLELTELLRDIYDNYHFTETVEGDDVKFSYRLLKGPADSRNAIRLLRAMGYDAAIADGAQERAERYEKTGRWEL